MIGSIRRECLDLVIVTANPSFVFRVLSSVENPSLLGEGLTGAKSDSAAGNGIRRGDTAGWWTTSPLRTTGCVKEPEPTMLRVVSAPPFGIRLRNVLPCTRVSPPESSRSANCVSSSSTRGITSLATLHGIFVRDNLLPANNGHSREVDESPPLRHFVVQNRHEAASPARGMAPRKTKETTRTWHIETRRVYEDLRRVKPSYHGRYVNLVYCDSAYTEDSGFSFSSVQQFGHAMALRAAESRLHHYRG